MSSVTQATTTVSLPRVAITYCTQCRWMLRAAYFGQELLSTFGTQIGEIALIPATGGLFSVELTYIPSIATPGDTRHEGKREGEVEVKNVLLWDRKAEGGFPETKVLKQRVRDHIDPKRDLGHSDRGGKKKSEETTTPITTTEATNTSPRAREKREKADEIAGKRAMSTVAERKNEEARAEGKRDGKIRSRSRSNGEKEKGRGREGATEEVDSGRRKEEGKSESGGATICEDCQ
ncbi:hypothetical protein P280DRAFT_250191 [Massarina eburnea CBS 473.64]|uniref:Uncharacterized protein n=1 Tax=Massarina eburnea CBS 473.64 TaxID=1395130 RepID=A0A6A6S625_9PLEO|nr:hypothetical protein P280DRAFT_250191 [Massarina eburnea CBS 473.64]